MLNDSILWRLIVLVNGGKIIMVEGKLPDGPLMLSSHLPIPERTYSKITLIGWRLKSSELFVS